MSQQGTVHHIHTANINTITALFAPRLVLVPAHYTQLLQSFLVAAQLEVQEILPDNCRDSGGGHTENIRRLVQDSLHKKRCAHFWKTESMSLTLMEVEPWSFMWDTGTSWCSPASRRMILDSGIGHHDQCLSRYIDCPFPTRFCSLLSAPSLPDYIIMIKKCTQPNSWMTIHGSSKTRQYRSRMPRQTVKATV